MIDQTLAHWRRSAFVWGRSDCVLSVADYVLAVTGKDPAADWRGVYSDETGAQAVAEGFGGVLGLVSHYASQTGLEPASAPLRGSVVVADLAGRQVAGLHLGQRSAFRTLRGVIELRAPILGAWNV